MSTDTVKPFHRIGGDEVVNTKYTDQINKLRNTFASGRTRNVAWRVKQLKALKTFLEDNMEAFADALMSDLRKNRMESVLYDVEFTLNDVNGALQEIDDWVKPQSTSKSLMTVLDKTYVWNEPFGLCLILGAWNYPVQLLLCPLVGAIAAGNVAVLKPSELAPATGAMMEKLTSYLDPDAFLVVNGGVPEATELLRERFDHIFYTGSTAVGKIVYAAAQKYLTPIVLELGGKSPVYLDSDVDVDIAGKRIVWGKTVNAGQTCVAPDYVLCHEAVYDQFLSSCKKALHDFYGDNPKSAPEYGRIVTSRHAKRLETMLQGAEIAVGGQVDADERYVAPTILTNVKENDPIMREEIFGPILPLIKVRDMTEAIKYINSRDKPLTAYVFSKDQKVVQRFIKETTSGSVCANDVLVHLSVDALPFGGVGQSGIGRYHGRYTFDTYSNKKAVLARDFNALGEYLGSKRYPPHTESGLALFRTLLAKRQNPLRFLCRLTPYIVGAAIGIGGTFLVKYLTITRQQQNP